MPRPSWPGFITPAQLVVLGSLPFGVLAGWAAVHGHGPQLAVVLPVLVSGWLLTTPYGSARRRPAVAVPVRVIPGAPTIPHLDPKTTWALLGAGATFVFWFYGARRRR